VRNAYNQYQAVFFACRYISGRIGLGTRLPQD